MNISHWAALLSIPGLTSGQSDDGRHHLTLGIGAASPGPVYEYRNSPTLAVSYEFRPYRHVGVEAGIDFIFGP
jgi:hypothetical protein